MSSSSPTAASIIPEIGSDPVASAREGLPYSDLEGVQDRLQVPENLLARTLGVSSRTLRRRSKSGKRTTRESDRLVLRAEIVGRAREALDGMDPAREWLSAPHSLLGGESPLEHMDTIAGMQEVETMLAQIEYGMPG